MQWSSQPRKQRLSWSRMTLLMIIRFGKWRTRIVEQQISNRKIPFLIFFSFQQVRRFTQRAVAIMEEKTGQRFRRFIQFSDGCGDSVIQFIQHFQSKKFTLQKRKHLQGLNSSPGSLLLTCVPPGGSYLETEICRFSSISLKVTKVPIL